jgi:hypothetical protein
MLPIKGKTEKGKVISLGRRKLLGKEKKGESTVTIKLEQEIQC